MKKRPKEFDFLYDFFSQAAFLKEYRPLPKSVRKGSYDFISLASAMKKGPAVKYLREIRNLNVQNGKRINEGKGSIDPMAIEWAIDDLLKLSSVKWMGEYRTNNFVVDLRMLHLRGLLYEVSLGLKGNGFHQTCFHFYMAGWWPVGFKGDLPRGIHVVAA